MSGTYQHREGVGSMLANTKTSDAQPDWRGDFMLAGTLYEVAGWNGTTAGGKARMSLKIQLSRQRDAPVAAPAPAARQEPARGGGKIDDDEIPF